MKTFNIFYSWQSDLPNKYNRGFIYSLLENVVKSVNKQNQIEFHAVVDRDTKDTPGAPDIVSTIFRKIDNCDVFIADISIINLFEENTVRRMPNPNVLLELGYAAARLGWDNVILLYNLDFGRIQDLPFDLQSRRPIMYGLSDENNKDKPEKRKVLKRQLQNNIIEIIERRFERIDQRGRVLFPLLHQYIIEIYKAPETLLENCSSPNN